METEDQFEPSSSRKTVIVKSLTLIKLYEDDFTIISTTLEEYEAQMNKWIKENPGLKDGKQLIEFVIDNCRSGDSIVDCKEIIEDFGFRGRLYYQIAYLLEKGSCFIFNKITMSYVEEIEIDTYGNVNDPPGSAGGRIFYLPRQEIYETEDWIS